MVRSQSASVTSPNGDRPDEPGVVDQDVEAAEVVDGAATMLVQVAADATSPTTATARPIADDLGDDRVRAGRIDVVDHDRRTLAGEP